MKSDFLKWLRLPLFFLGLIVLFVGERYLGTESYHLYLTIAGLVLGVLGLAATGILYATSSTEDRRSWCFALAWQLSVFAGVLFYFLYRKVLGDAAEPTTFAAKGLLALWLSLVILGLAAGMGCEWAIKDGGTGVHAEPWRVKRSALSWFGIGLLLVGLFGINFAANKKDKTSDWSYLKTTQPSESSRLMLKTLSGSDDLTIALFYPRGNEVLPAVSEYFNALAASEPRVKIQIYDKDLQPTQAETYKVSRNGQVVLDFAGKRSRIDTGLELTKARKTLRQLDGEFQKSFLEATSSRKTIYFTRGHGEFSWLGEKSDDPLKSLRLLEGFLKQQNFNLRLFGTSDGSATAIPDDAAAVVIVGASSAFQPEEINVLKSYLERGGSVMAFLDLDKSEDRIVIGNDDQPLLGLLAETGIKFDPTVLANDRTFVTATHSDADKWFLLSNIYTSHESVVSLSRHDERIATLTFQGGSFVVTPAMDGWKATETVRALADTFKDFNRNFKFDEAKEKRESYAIGAVSEKLIGGQSPDTKAPNQKPKDSKRARVVAFGDATVLSDALVRNPGNALFFADSLKWLVGQADIAGAPTTEEDVRIRHTRKENVIWFHATVVAMPLLVLLAGYFATRRRKRRPAPVTESAVVNVKGEG